MNLDPLARCINDKIDIYRLESLEFNAHIIESLSQSPQPEEEDPHWLIHFVGNGVVGVETRPNSPIYIRNTKVLSLAVPFQPITSVFLSNSEARDYREASVLQYANGLAHKIQCIPHRSGCLSVTHQFYAHRTIPSLLVQDIKITNPTDEDITLNLEQGGLSKWPTSVVYTRK